MQSNDNLEKYFSDGLTWYNHKIIHPLYERSILIVLSFCILVFCAIMAANIYAVLPMTQRVRYIIGLTDPENKSIRIIKPSFMTHDPVMSLASVMVDNYVVKRESYNYNNLQEQASFIAVTSSDDVAEQFTKYMSISNPISPVLRYKNTVKRNIEIVSKEYLGNNKMNVVFRSIAKTSNKLIENIKWSALVEYEIDQPRLKSEYLQSNDMRFKFIVKNYSIKILAS